MPVTLGVRNRSVHKRLVRRDRLARLAGRICTGEGLCGVVEISLLVCDDEAIADLNSKYRHRHEPTDVLSFEQNGALTNGPRLLGDIVISLETAARNCGGDRERMRREVDMLFCHGLLHLLGYDHDTKRRHDEMKSKQAAYLQQPESDAWNFGVKERTGLRDRSAAHPGGGSRVGR